MRLLLRLGLAPRATVLLTVPGRRSGKPRSTPVTLVEEDGQRWLVSPFGPVGWLHNARAGGQVALTRGRHSETVRMEELSPKAAVPILKACVERVPVTDPISTSPGRAVRRLHGRVPQVSRLPGRPKFVCPLTYPNG
jgi:deazaflavin-dependent oxidoreductase (nitroreductase family)